MFCILSKNNRASLCNVDIWTVPKMIPTRPNGLIDELGK